MATQENPTPPPLSPYLTVSDGRAACDFYTRAFGAQVLSQQPTPDGKKLIHAALSVNGGVFMLSDDFPEMTGSSRTPKAFGGTPVTLHLDLPDVETTWTQALAAGATVVMPLADQFWGDKYGIVEDPFGHRWSLATRKKVATQAELDAGAEKHFPSKS